MEKLDLVKLDPAYYRAGPAPSLLDVAATRHLALTGQGDPDAPAFAEALEALYSTAYALKFESKAAGRDYAVPRLEGFWRYDTSRYPGLTQPQTQVPRAEWQYQLALRLPDFIIEAQVQAAAARNQRPRAAAVALLPLPARRVVQLLHVGPFATEHVSLARLREFMDAHGLRQDGPHQEIYLNDFRKTAPEKLRTILREPVVYS